MNKHESCKLCFTELNDNNKYTYLRCVECNCTV